MNDADEHFERIARSRDVSGFRIGQEVLWHNPRGQIGAGVVEKINPRTAYPLQLEVNDGSLMVLPGEVTVMPPRETLEQVEAFLNEG